MKASLRDTVGLSQVEGNDEVRRGYDGKHLRHSSEQRAEPTINDRGFQLQLHTGSGPSDGLTSIRRYKFIANLG